MAIVEVLLALNVVVLGALGSSHLRLRHELSPKSSARQVLEGACAQRVVGSADGNSRTPTEVPLAVILPLRTQDGAAIESSKRHHPAFAGSQP